MSERDIALVRVGYLRELHKTGKPIPPRHEIDPVNLFNGSNISDWVSLYVVVWVWRSENHPDPDGVHLNKLVTLLATDPVDQAGPEANDDDLVYMDWVSLPMSREWLRTRLKAGFEEAASRLSMGAIAAHAANAANAASCTTTTGPPAVLRSSASGGALGAVERAYESSWPCFMYTTVRARSIVLTEVPTGRARFEERCVLAADHASSRKSANQLLLPWPPDTGAIKWSCCIASPSASASLTWARFSS